MSVRVAFLAALLVVDVLAQTDIQQIAPQVPAQDDAISKTAALHAQLEADLAAMRRDFETRRKALQAEQEADLAADVARRSAAALQIKSSLEEKRAALATELRDLDNKQRDAERDALTLAADAALAKRLQESVKAKVAALTRKEEDLAAFGADLDAKVASEQQQLVSQLNSMKGAHGSLLQRLARSEQAASARIQANSAQRLHELESQLKTSATQLEARYVQRLEQAQQVTHAKILNSKALEDKALEHLQQVKAHLMQQENAERETASKLLEQERRSLAQSLVETKLTAEKAIAHARNAGDAAILQAQRAAAERISALQVTSVSSWGFTCVNVQPTRVVHS